MPVLAAPAVVEVPLPPIEAPPPPPVVAEVPPPPIEPPPPAPGTDT